MKKPLATSILMFALALGLEAQTTGSLDSTLQPLKNDLGKIMTSICRDVAPELLATTLAGDIVGEAAFKGGFPHGSFSLVGAGFAVGQGLATALNDKADSNWEFLLKIPTAIQNQVGTTGIAADLYGVSRNVFPYPALALGLGFAPTKNFEILANGMFIPQAATDLAVGFLPDAKKLAPTFSVTSVVVKLRQVFFRDEGGFPAMSLAFGGAYSDFNLGAKIKLSDLTGSTQKVEGLGDLDLDGKVGFNTQSFAGGIDFHVSKKLLVFIPFAKLGIWYQQSRTSQATDLTAIIKSAGAADITYPIVMGPSATVSDVSAMVTTGLELKLLALIIHFSASFDLEQPLFVIPEATKLSDARLTGLSLRTGLRFSF